MYVALPPDWVRGNGISPKDELAVDYNDERVIVKRARADAEG